MSSRSFIVRVATEHRAPAILSFHEQRLTQYLWPRDLAYFAKLAESESLYEVVETTDESERLVGICYITEERWPDGRPRFEFGGVYVEEDCRGLGLASALGIIAISNHFAWNARRGLQLIGPRWTPKTGH